MDPLARRRIVRRQAGPVDGLPSDLHPLVARLYAARGVADAEAVDLSLNRLPPPAGMAGLDAATELLASAVMEGCPILVVGDFDADGATATALMMRALAAMGVECMDFAIPDRIRAGYGLSPALVEQVGAPPQAGGLMITVDNGISSHAGVDAAHAVGWRVLVTDHHLPGETLPTADAIVDPNLDAAPQPSGALAGVGVAFYLLARVRAALTDAGWFQTRGIQPPRLADHLDLVALGTVADVVPLDRVNRILVRQGLERIRAGAASPGILALMRVAGRDPARAGAQDLGFAVGPRLNAAGRLDDMALGVECLLCDDPAQAATMAATLDGINRERREVEARMREEAESQVAAWLEANAGTELPPALVLHEPDWHPGVVGLVAGRIKERFHRPTVAFAEEGEDGLKGSARSIAGFHMRDALARIQSLDPDLMQRFGGHAMAAGLSLDKDRLDRFQERLIAVAEEQLDAETLEGRLETDGGLTPAERVLEAALALEEAGPWGQAFPEPLFDDVFLVTGRREVGTGHLRLSVRAAGTDGPSFTAMAWNAAHAPVGEGQSLRLVYSLDVDRFRGRESVRLTVKHMQEEDQGLREMGT